MKMALTIGGQQFHQYQQHLTIASQVTKLSIFSSPAKFLEA